MLTEFTSTREEISCNNFVTEKIPLELIYSASNFIVSM